MKTFSLTRGSELPAIGFGTWKIDGAAMTQALRGALQAGYAHIDCAPVYGNEAEVGDALRPILGQPGARDRLWITSKLWNADHHPSRVRAACRQTLDDLGVNHLDLYLIHWPVAFKEGVQWPEVPGDILGPRQSSLADTWAAMEKLVDEGLVRHIGVSNFSVRNLQRIQVHARIAPLVNQIECHPYLPQTELADWCRHHGIHVTAYSPLGSADRPPLLKLPHEQAVLDDPVVRDVAANLGATPAQVLIAWQLSHGRSVLCKSTSPARLAQNLAAQQLVLSLAQRARLDAVSVRQRYVNPAAWFAMGSPVTEDDVWRNSAHGPISGQLPS